MNPVNATAASASAVVAALQAVPAGERMLRANPTFLCIKHGRTNETWRVVGGALDWVVRVGLGHDERLAIDRDREADLLRRASAAGFAPPVIGICAQRRVLICGYISAPEPDEQLVRSAAFAFRLGQRLRALHALPVPDGAVPLDLRAVLDHYLAISAPHHALVPRHRIVALLHRHLPDYARSGLALCHHDVHRGNLRLTEPLLLIDWEYAAWSDPLLDLAAFASGENLAPEASAELLAGYGPAAGIDPDALRRARVLFDCLNALWLDAADGWRDLAAGARMQLCARLDNPL